MIVVVVVVVVDGVVLRSVAHQRRCTRDADRHRHVVHDVAVALPATNARHVGDVGVRDTADFSLRCLERRFRQQHACEAAMHTAAVVLSGKRGVEWRLLASDRTSLLQRPLDRLTERTDARFVLENALVAHSADALALVGVRRVCEVAGVVDFRRRFDVVSCPFMNSAIVGVSLRFLLDSRLATPSWPVFGVFENLKLRNFQDLHFSHALAYLSSKNPLTDNNLRYERFRTETINKQSNS